MSAFEKDGPKRSEEMQKAAEKVKSLLRNKSAINRK